MTKNQRTKLVSRIAMFVIAFSMFMVLIPYVAVFLAVYYSVQLARQI